MSIAPICQRPQAPPTRWLLAFLCVLASASSLTARAADVEEHIRHIQDHLLPPVLVEAEPSGGTPLAVRMQALHVPAVSIAVIHGGKLEWARGFGVTGPSGSAVTPQTLFQAASISKPVTALAVLHLVQAGSLDLDTDVNRYLKSWKLPPSELSAQHPVTLRELLTHTAGITVHGFPGYVAGEPVPTLTQVLDGAAPANSPPIRVDTAPGSLWRYSGGGYVIVQKLLEDTTGQPFEQLLRDSVLKPIGMNDSSYEQPLPPNRATQVALPVRPNGQPVKGGPHIYPERSAAGLWTTPSDLARYAIAVQQALAGRSTQVINAATAQAMLTPGMNHQGLGPQVPGSPAHPYFEHGGANEGYRCELMAYESGDGAVIMTSSDAGDRLIPEILRTIAHEYGWPDFQPAVRHLGNADPQELDRLTGSYRMALGFTMTFTREGTRLLVQIPGQMRVEEFPQTPSEYFSRIVDARLSFTLDAQGPASGVVLHQNGQDIPGTRMDAAEAAQVASALAATNLRVATQSPQTGSEAALRQLLKELAQGKPDYARLGPVSAQLIQEQLPSLQRLLTGLGELSNVAFEEVTPAGATVYRVTWQHGAGDITLVLSADGKADLVNMAMDD